MELITYIAVGLVTVCSLFYLYFKHAFSYWESKGVPYLPPEIPIGNLRGFSKTIHSSTFIQNIYTQLKGKGKFAGMYFTFRPIPLLLDLELIKSVLIRDFHNFTDRGFFYNEKDDPLSAHLFSIDGKKWRGLRMKLTPTFTSGKMKFMFPTIVEVSDRFKVCLENAVNENEELEIKELLARFTTDVIGTCAFGIECNSLNDPEAEFRRMGRKAIGEPKFNIMVQILINSFKPISRKLGVRTIHNDVSDFFMKVVHDTVEYREKNNIQRNDFMDLLIKMKNEKKEGQSSGVTMNEIAAQAFVFFLAGFETSSTTMMFCLYELAQNPTIQEKTRQEIRAVLKRHDNNFTYDAMMEMKYTEQVINETLRKYPPVPNLIRKTLNDYPVPDTNLVIKKGMSVWIPAYALQHDPEYYPDPEKFDPDRFSPEETAKRDSILWLPFGDGPRNCIGLRFGMMQTRIGLVMLLNNFEFSVCSKTSIPLKITPQSFILSPEGGIYLKVKKCSV